MMNGLRRLVPRFIRQEIKSWAAHVAEDAARQTTSTVTADVTVRLDALRSSIDKLEASVEQLPAALRHEETAEDVFDLLVGRTDHEPSQPRWTNALRKLHKHSRGRRLQVIPEFFYSPAWTPEDLPASVWEGTYPVCGEFDLEKQKAFLRDTPAFPDELAALPWEAIPGEDAGFSWGNDQFSHADAALYYALIRRFQPRRIVEVGSGHSTKLALRAIRDNGSGQILCIDPHPPAWLASLEGPIEIRQEPVQSTPDSVFLGLEPPDILFIDDSHVSKTGSDVNHLFLRILPRLPAGVLVQIHDICLPFEYPRYWSEDALCYWNEQYVLAALLANSSKFEVLVGVYFLSTKDRETLRPFLPRLERVMPAGGSLWLCSRE